MATMYKYSFELKPSALPPPAPDALRFRYEDPTFMQGWLELQSIRREEERTKRAKHTAEIKAKTDCPTPSILRSEEKMCLQPRLSDFF